MDQGQESKKEKVKVYLLVGALLILLYWGLNHMSMLGGLLKSFIGVIMPFIIGGAIAFIFNVPMKSI